MTMAFDAMSDTSDEELLSLYANGDQAAARALMLRHAPRVLSLARRMLKDQAEAEDVTQEAMLRLWKIAPDWRTGEAKVSTWLYRVGSNLCTDRLRKKRGISLDEAPEMEDETLNVEDQLISADRARALRLAMNRLPERQKLALTLRHFEEQSNPEIASALETSVEAVESLLSRARRALAADLSSNRSTLGLAID
ncbi:RNA polymerase subunit sigma [Rhodobacterales bacterium 52_120_T64]|nr:RNA polymerase subunit sigma [Rhodobacterales bacterium 52_120_T64]